MQTTLSYQNTEPFWDRIAPKYARKPISDPVAYEEKLSNVRGLLQTADRILEIGCGTGGTALRLAPGVSQVTATDVSRCMIEIAQSKLGPDAPANVTFRQADAAELIDGYAFDVICAFSLLHLVDNIPQVLSSARQQLKPGGLFISKTVCLSDGPLPIRAFVRALTAVGLAPRVASLSKTELVRKLKDAGFEIETVSHYGQQHTNPFIIARRPSY
jgi:ubiquinone/menaquinone biosynthesis C-methylase UbiE